MEILAVGGSLWDILIELKTPFSGDDCYPSIISRIPGGTARNLAETAARLKVEVTLISPIALDGIEKTIPTPGSITPIITNHTPTFIGVLSSQKKRLFSFHDTGPLDYLTVEEILPYLPDKPPAYVFLDTNLPAEVIFYLLKWSKSYDSITMVDPIAPSRVTILSPYLSLIDIISPSEREYRVLANLGNLMDKTIIIKKGAEGVKLLSPSGSLISPTLHKGTIVSDNGAGDSFNGGFLYGLLKQYPLDECIRIGQTCASWCLKSPLNVNPDLSEKLIQNN
ncbi:MAG: Pseudouridine kinase [candidate division WS2 bacterium]|uniref:Pseudouridine kinase n=1 Tax=Psychracetigena formicireducens TaxID=2986056 RepID=A0A9E2F4H4_PSYF1|nr:Pseudouridine kinase [Candidatus Psychracetigena formicireducens]MBT9145016.1 Pseudouridine kinase [Candidatus Psychracetigena formicireducens]MBT9151154.1 Pseudouridine kinase [Candidatus Psychracetigena formicireducens]